MTVRHKSLARRLSPQPLASFPVPPQPDASPEASLTIILTWARERFGAQHVTTAFECAAQNPGNLPSPVSSALSHLEQLMPTPLDDLDQKLATLFERLEATASFRVLQRRHLPVDARPPSRKTLGNELGVTSERVRQLELQGRRLVTRELTDKHSPLRIAVWRLRAHLGPVARASELDGAIDSTCPGDTAFKPGHPRRQLLAQFAGYNRTRQWLLDPHIEDLTRALLFVLTEDGPESVDNLCERVAQLGVRRTIRLPWIATQEGFRIVNGTMTRIPPDPVQAALTLMRHSSAH